ncbi:MAG: hypothetical protein HPY66_2718 [Firmicutes bacterium]|nr:hypothetical protein [Bacillota bacterium]
MHYNLTSRNLYNYVAKKSANKLYTAIFCVVILLKHSYNYNHEGEV